MNIAGVQVISVALDRLIHDPNNPNKMSDEDYASLAANIKRAGAMLQPILVQEAGDDEGELRFKIVDGHHRAKASADAGLTHVIAVVWDGTEEMRQAVAIGFNKIHGELDLAGVQRTLSELAAAGWSSEQMTVTGYSQQEITDLLKVATDIDPDSIMENPSGADEKEPAQATGTFALELTFNTRKDLNRARKALRKAANNTSELGEGFLTILDKAEEEMS